MTQNLEMKSLYERIVLETSDFEVDNPVDYTLRHKRLPILVEFPGVLERGATTHVNMIASFFGKGSPEAIIESLQFLIQRRDFLRRQGYEPGERFGEYDDGIEYVYDVPTESPEDLTRLIQNFGKCDRYEINKMTQNNNIEVSSDCRSLLVEGREIFRIPLPEERVRFVGRHEDSLLIAADCGCCPPGTVYNIGKGKSPPRDDYELNEVYATGLPVTAFMLTTSGILSVGHGCYSGVRFTKRDGTRIDIVDEEMYRSLRHHEHNLTYGGGLEPKLKLDEDKIILQLELIERVPNRTLLEMYEREKKAGRNPFPITALEHPTDTYASRGVVEHLDLIDMLRSIGVTAQDVLPLEIVYNSKENWLKKIKNHEAQ